MGMYFSFNFVKLSPRDKMITEKELSYADMKAAENRGCLCVRCQSRLWLAWGGAFHEGWILRCSDLTHTGMTSHDIKQELLKREAFSMDSTALTIMSEEKMLERVGMSRFPQDLTKPEKLLLARAAVTYGFDPLMGEITLYQGKPFVSIDGRYRKAQETNRLDGVESRPATKEEREDWGIPDGDYFFRAEVYVKDSTRSFVGWGRVFASETVPGSNRQNDTTSKYKPIQSNPQRMAEKRAETQALRKGFHIPLPGMEDIGLPDYHTDSNGVKLHTVTGELIDTKVEDPDKLFEKEGGDLFAEALAVVDKAPEPELPIDLQWLREQIAILDEKKVSGWSETGVISRLGATTGKTSASLSEAVRHLTPEQAEVVVKRITEVVALA